LAVNEFTSFVDGLHYTSKESPLQNIDNSLEIIGYRVKIWPRDSFRILGYTRIIPPGPEDGPAIAAFWREVIADGRLAKLQAASAVRLWVLGLGSWDEECPKKGQRYTIAIGETGQTDFSALAKEYLLHTYDADPSKWMCFELNEQQFKERFWQDDPYRMMKKIGYKFNGKVGVHFDAYPPEYDPEKNQNMEFWISVVERG
jgi:hypothetical protein